MNWLVETEIHCSECKHSQGTSKLVSKQFGDGSRRSEHNMLVQSGLRVLGPFPTAGALSLFAVVIECDVK